MRMRRQWRDASWWGYNAVLFGSFLLGWVLGAVFWSGALSWVVPASYLGGFAVAELYKSWRGK